MEEIIKIKDTSYVRYEELLIRRDTLKKAAFQYQMNYIMEFGDLMAQAFEAKIKCIEKKKIIAFCQKRQNRGEIINQNDLDRHVEAIMADYYAQLHRMLLENKLTQEKELISELTFRKIKSLYYKIAKLIHPDMNPSLKEDKTVKDLWNRAVVSYNCNNPKELEEVHVLVSKYLESIDYHHERIGIPDINERIFALNEEIDNIIHTNPYQYKYLLEDKEAVEDIKKELKQEIKDYRNYAKELDEIIKSFKIERYSA